MTKGSSAAIIPACNLCGSRQFNDYRGRPAELCSVCGGKARHRVALDVYRRYLFPLASNRPRILHLAPEKALHSILEDRFGAGYITADLAPERYPHARALRVRLPEGIDIFPGGYFDAVIHNHVLEHVPGHYGDHVPALLRIVRPGGFMIFSVPGPYMDRLTVEGGEHLATDAERLQTFLQEDHFKLFGCDFLTWLDQLAGAERLPDGVSDETRRRIGVRPGKSPFMVLRKTGDSPA